MSQPNPQAETQEYIFDMKSKWLKDFGLSYKDILEDEDGEYIMVEPILMDEGEPESATFKKVYLPTDREILDELQARFY